MRFCHTRLCFLVTYPIGLAFINEKVQINLLLLIGLEVRRKLRTYTDFCGSSIERKRDL